VRSFYWGRRRPDLEAKASKGEWGESVPLPSRLQGLGERCKQCGLGPAKTVLVHIERRRTPVDCGHWEITQKIRIFLTGGSYAPYAPCIATPLVRATLVFVTVHLLIYYRYVHLINKIISFMSKLKFVQYFDAMYVLML